MTSQAFSIGVDISLAELVIAYFGDTTAPIKLANNAAEIKRWLKRLPPDCTIGMEATGIHHRLLADLAFAAGHTVFVLNPRDVALYLKSLRSRGKTDVLDARGIARYTHNETDKCHAYVPLTMQQQTITTLIQRRHQVVKSRTSLRMSFADTSQCAQALGKLMRAFEALIAEIDSQLKALLAADEGLNTRCKNLRSIQGIGPLISAALAMRMSRVRYANSDALVAAVGLDPRPRESGQYTGTRHLSKRGNPEERRLLYLAAVSACRHPIWKTIQTALLKKGLSSTAVYCIIARKILRIAFAVWNSGVPYDPRLVGRACAPT
ncbi:transposase [Vogesella urethralis]|uniref:transposase n=1 Tax=Vogesella urethralis TaxID=2592656 RepID=UPI001186C32F|nr:transposase [Vogesella urethralis]